MGVYVDPAVHPFGRMKMCHMMADTRAELILMAHHLGVSVRWIQNPGTSREHFDISKGKRALAIRAGAIEVSAKDLGRLMLWRDGRGPRPDFVVGAE